MYSFPARSAPEATEQIRTVDSWPPARVDDLSEQECLIGLSGVFWNIGLFTYCGTTSGRDHPFRKRKRGIIETRMSAISVSDVQYAGDPSYLKRKHPLHGALLVLSQRLTLNSCNSDTKHAMIRLFALLTPNATPSVA